MLRLPRAALAVVAAGLLLALPACRRDGKPAAPPDPATWRPSTLPRIDLHTHITPDGTANAVRMLRAHGIVHAINLSGGSPGHGLETQLAAAASTGGFLSVFTTPDWREAQFPGYGARMAAKIARAHDEGAIGVKITKGLGLGYVGPDGKLLAVDDPGLDPMFEKAGELGMPVAIHTGDPKAFWKPIGPENERYDELRVHPGWGYYGEPVPSWEELYAQFERRVARHPKTTFVGLHFGNDPEDPAHVAAMLDKYPNLYIDTAARIPEIGRQDAQRMHDLFVKYQDRILFGTDAGFGADPTDVMLGSTGAAPPTPAEVDRFWDSTWRYFETRQRGMLHPTPIQGNWTIDGVGLPEDVLAKVYAGNAARLLKLPLPSAAR